MSVPGHSTLSLLIGTSNSLPVLKTWKVIILGINVNYTLDRAQSFPVRDMYLN